MDTLRWPFGMLVATVYGVALLAGTGPTTQTWAAEQGRVNQPARVSGDNSERASLAGITSIGVTVESLPARAAGLGLNRETFQAIVELRLRRSGVRVSETSRSFLYVNITPLPIGSTDDRLVAYSMVLQFAQPAILVNNGRTKLVTTWWRQEVGASGAFEFSRKIKVPLEELVDTFINDYLAANEK